MNRPRDAAVWPACVAATRVPSHRFRDPRKMTITLLLLVALLAFANGSNDNSKGVATLVGFGAARPTQALVYATVATALGGVVSFFLAAGLLKGFSGDWLF